jgi:hypothetical protein
MDVPEKWRGYACMDYFASPLADSGYWDEAGQLWLIEPYERIKEEQHTRFLQVGRPGFDSIGLGYRKGEPGFWAIHRIEGGRFQYLAPSVQALLDGTNLG